MVKKFDLESYSYESFTDVAVRHGFIRRVFLVIMLMMTFTVGVVCIFIFVDAVALWIYEHSYVLWISMGITLVIYFLLLCVPVCRRKKPYNIILLVIFTAGESVMLAAIATMHAKMEVLIATGSTVAICLALILFALNTRCDFTTCGGIMIVLSVVMLIFGIICIFFYNKILKIVYGSIGTLVFGIFLVFDIQTLMIGKRQVTLDPRDYIVGAIQIYMDIVMIFYYLITLISGVNS